MGRSENPPSGSESQPQALPSGIGLLSGWVCEAAEVEFEIATAQGETERHGAAYGTERLDTEAVCGDVDNGFGLLFNWNRLGDGEHTVTAFNEDDARSSFAPLRAGTLLSKRPACGRGRVSARGASVSTRPRPARSSYAQ